MHSNKGARFKAAIVHGNELFYLGRRRVFSQLDLKKFPQDLLHFDCEFRIWQFLAFNNRRLELVNRHHQNLRTSNQFLGDLAACFQDEKAKKKITKRAISQR